MEEVAAGVGVEERRSVHRRPVEAASTVEAARLRLQGLGRAARINTPLLPRRAREAAVA